MLGLVLRLGPRLGQEVFIGLEEWTAGHVLLPSRFSIVWECIFTYMYMYVDRGRCILRFLSLSAYNHVQRTTDGLDDWTFTTAKYWGETPLGLWTLTITDHPHCKNNVLYSRELMSTARSGS